MITSLRIKYFFTLLFVFSCIGMSHSTNAAVRKQLFTSPTKVGKPIINYCKEIIAALNNNDLDGFKGLWKEFFSKIRYPIKIHDKKFYLAASYCLASCLAANTKGDIQIYTNINDDLIYLAIQINNNNYIIQFHTTETAEKTTQPIRTYQNASAKNIEYEVLGIEINPETIFCGPLSNNGPKVATPTQMILSYQKDNFIKKMMVNGLISHDMKAFTEALATIYNNVPQLWLINREKFYQSLLAWILIFMGNALTMPEETTGFGRTDITAINPSDTNIIEYKLNRSAQAALTQIEKKGYASTLHTTDKTTTMIGVNVNTKKDPIVVSTQCKEYEPIAPSPFKKKRPSGKRKRMPEEPANDTVHNPFGKTH